MDICELRKIYEDSLYTQQLGEVFGNELSDYRSSEAFNRLFEGFPDRENLAFQLEEYLKDEDLNTVLDLELQNQEYAIQSVDKKHRYSELCKKYGEYYLSLANEIVDQSPALSQNMMVIYKSYGQERIGLILYNAIKYAKEFSKYNVDGSDLIQYINPQMRSDAKKSIAFVQKFLGFDIETSQTTIRKISSETGIKTGQLAVSILNVFANLKDFESDISFTDQEIKLLQTRKSYLDMVKKFREYCIDKRWGKLKSAENLEIFNKLVDLYGGELRFGAILNQIWKNQTGHHQD